MIFYSVKKVILTIAIVLIVGFVVYAAVSKNNLTLFDNESGIRGEVLIGPTCPVIRVNDPNCADKRYVTKLEAVSGEGKVYKVSTNAEGSFVINLPAGIYTLKKDSDDKSILPTLSPVKVVIQPKVYTMVKLIFDSGLR